MSNTQVTLSNNIITNKLTLNKNHRKIQKFEQEKKKYKNTRTGDEGI